MSIACRDVYGQDMSVIQLKQEHVDYAPKSVYISDVTDSLGDKGMGTITDSAKKTALTMPGGMTMAIKTFIDHNLTQDKAKQAFVLNVAKMDFDIKKKGTLWVINAKISIAFYAGHMKLMEYSGSGHAEMDTDPREYTEQFIRQAIAQDIEKLDGWWMTHKNDVAVSDAAKVTVAVGTTINKPNCIVYSLQEPLAISDFTGPVHNDVGEMAATYSGMGFATMPETENGQMTISVTVTPYFDRTMSWFKEEGKNPILLAHEQAHFDITAIKACELAQAIRKATYTRDNYLAVLTQLEQQYSQAANDEQNTYDTETAHGTIADKQQQWQQKISKEVKACGCY